MKGQSLCRASMCLRWAVRGFDLCDHHLEREEEGHPVRRVASAAPRTPRTPREPRGLADLPAKERREKIKAVVRKLNAKRIGR